jgi:hypothetical protein
VILEFKGILEPQEPKGIQDLKGIQELKEPQDKQDKQEQQEQQEQQDPPVPHFLFKVQAQAPFSYRTPIIPMSTQVPISRS